MGDYASVLPPLKAVPVGHGKRPLDPAEVIEQRRKLREFERMIGKHQKRKLPSQKSNPLLSLAQDP
jgi:hypothetical protein